MRWRELESSDAGLVEEVAAACLDADGGHPLGASGPHIRSLLEAPGALRRGGFGDGRRLAAWGVIREVERQGRMEVQIVGQVHPACRGRGLGRDLLAWSVGSAEGVVRDGVCGRGGAGTGVRLCISTEGVTAGAEALYARFRFKREFAEDVMRRDLRAPLSGEPLPEGVRVVPWSAERASEFFEAYRLSFRDRPGFPGWSAERWIEWTAGDEELAPEHSLLALEGGAPAGFVTCTRDWIIQLGVRPERRRRRLGTALTTEALTRMQSAGVEGAWLDVSVDNPGAARLYEGMGFGRAGRSGGGQAHPRLSRERAVGHRSDPAALAQPRAEHRPRRARRGAPHVRPGNRAVPEDRGGVTVIS